MIEPVSPALGGRFSTIMQSGAGGRGRAVIIIHISHGCSEDGDRVYIKPLAVFLVHIYCSTNGSFKKMCSLKKKLITGKDKRFSRM